MNDDNHGQWRDVADARELHEPPPVRPPPSGSMRVREPDDWEPFKRSADEGLGFMGYAAVIAVLVLLGSLYVLSCGALTWGCLP